MIYYNEKNIRLELGNALDLLKDIPDESIDIVITDPPYFLSNGGITVSSGKQVSVNKGDWDSANNVNPEEFYIEFLTEVKRVLTKNGTIWIFGTMHNIYLVGYLLQKFGFKILNNVTWQKTNPAPNLSGRMFTHSTETIIWARKDSKNGKQIFNYQLMKKINGGKQMKDVWQSAATKKSEKTFGKHPTQKPLWLLERLIEASTEPGSIILDPFVGSGTTAVAALKLGRSMIGMDISSDFLDIAKARLDNLDEEK